MLRACRRKTTWAQLVLSLTLKNRDLQVEEPFTSDPTCLDIRFLTYGSAKESLQKTLGAAVHV